MLEEVIQDEIIDETDTFESNEHDVPVVRRPGRDRPDVSSYLALFEHKIRDQNRLSPPEVQAVSAFLLTAVPEFSIFASVETVLKVCLVYPPATPACFSSSRPSCRYEVDLPALTIRDSMTFHCSFCPGKARNCFR